MEDLRSHFDTFGEIESIRVLPEKECGFVNYVLLKDAVTAKETMEGFKFENTIIKIGYGKVESIQEPGTIPTKSLWVGNLAVSIKAKDLEEIFLKFGHVESVRVLIQKNCGFVNFIDVEDAISAREELDGQELSGSVVKIGFAKVPTVPKTDAVSPIQSILKAFEEPMTPRQSVIAIPSLKIQDLPPPTKNDQIRLREIRKKLESNCTNRDLESIFQEILPSAVELSSGTRVI